MTQELKKITDVLLPIQEEHGGIPKSVISDAMTKMGTVGLAEQTKEWLSQQGQYCCVHNIIATYNTRQLINVCMYTNSQVCV